jgi:hypothetical protein
MAPLDPVIQWLLRTLLSFVLLRAAWHKSRDLAAFRNALSDYALLPRAGVPAAALGLAVAELATAAALLVPATSQAAAWAAAGLLGLYSLAIALNLLRGRREIDCGCGGPAGGRPLGEALLLRNALLGAAAVACTAPVAARALGVVDVVTVGAGAAVASLLYAAIDLAFGSAAQLRLLRSDG